MAGRGPALWRQSGCCGGDIARIEIQGSPIGLVGLREALEQVYILGRRPDAAVADELLAMIKLRNYVAPAAEEAYKAALLREYISYHAKRTT